MTNVKSSNFYDELSFGVFEFPNTKLVFNDLPKKRIINRKVFLANLKQYSREPLKTFPMLKQSCPFCQFQLEIVEKKIYNNFDGWDVVDSEFCLIGVFECRVGAFEYCQNCFYWCCHFISTEFEGRGFNAFHSYTSQISKLQTFNEELPEGCSTEIAQHLRRNSRLWHTIKPSSLEKLVADVFKSNYQNAEVVHVGKPDDGGVDIIFIESNRCKWLIQVKRREKTLCGEGVSTIRNLIGTMILEKSNYGIVVSTADHFTYRAYQAVNKADEVGLTIKLVDRGILNKMLDPFFPDRPWLKPISQIFPDLADCIAARIPSNRQLKLFPI